MLLSQLQKVLLKCETVNFVDTNIEFVTSDSRHVQAGALFIALSGYMVDGHQFAERAVAAGAKALLVEHELPIAVPQLVVPDTRLAAALVVDRFYDHPSQHLRMIGVTGTNGKTTTTYLIEKLLNDAGFQTGLLGTIEKRVAGASVDVRNTTPDTVELQSSLQEMVEAGCQYGIMEVSSHALELQRVAGTRYHVAVFTNLTQDHLDFHGTMETYLAAKGKLFSRLGNTYGDDVGALSYGVLNADDAASTYLARQTVYECVTYGIENPADVRATDVAVYPDGVRFHLTSFAGEADVRLKLTGRFNVYNALAAISVGLIEDLPLAQILQSLSGVTGVPGRMERVEGGQPFTVVVDYSHTPDSLSNALQTVQEFASGRVITVVGCGGDRDKTKRPLMAQVATQYSQLTMLTSDNPRTEDPERILDDMEQGLAGSSLPANHRYERITDRKQAIMRAIALAEANDVVLIAGKGHETYQIIGRTKFHFDDREVAGEAIAAKL
ncbi:MAG: UDP-N-acetylmuramoyl-L-alanyl-D-glutamate--2,6-diaminopimelate ligase [Alicyclobacillus sp. RIFOXYA1_FULL_53_8]|nr:MAG: UDP-N-acetylmuramoyl-L-alanyl-D-glutamate--2,6-diaminopimelate ligase [Alicyclobacillus sp. RIFOXYA1_FULL_53_8]